MNSQLFISFEYFAAMYFIIDLLSMEHAIQQRMIMEKSRQILATIPMVTGYNKVIQVQFVLLCRMHFIYITKPLFILSGVLFILDH